MSIYNMVHGNHYTAPLVLALLATEPSELARFRDAWVEKTPGGEIRLVVYTRSGGANRGHYGDEGHKAGPECPCSGCAITYKIPKYPLYISDADDPYEPTYAKIYFRLPDNYEEKLKMLGAPDGFKLENVAIDPPDMGKKWDAALEGIRQATARR